MAEALANKLKARYMEGEERKLNAAHAAYALRFSAASLRGSDRAASCLAALS